MLVKKIPNLYILACSEKYIVVNKKYEGLLVLDHNFHLLKDIFIDDGILFYQSILCGDILLLLCEENRCVYYVDINKSGIKYIQLETKNVFTFSKIFILENNSVFFFGNSANDIIFFDFEKGNVSYTDKNRFEETNNLYYMTDLSDKDILVYKPWTHTAIIKLGTKYYNLQLYGQKREIHLNSNIIKRMDNYDSSQMKLYLRDFCDDIYFFISEKEIIVQFSVQCLKHIYPPEAEFSFYDVRAIKKQNEILLFAICHDNSSKSKPLLIKYILRQPLKTPNFSEDRISAI